MRAPRIRARLAWIPALLVLLGAAQPARGTDAELEMARKARAGIVRLRWRDARFSRMTVVRNAVVVRSDGLLVVAGVPLDAEGTLVAQLADGRELPAELLAADVQTALSLVRVRAAGLSVLPLRSEPPPPSPPGPSPDAPTGPPPLAYAPIGLRVLMVTSDGSVAMGPVRSTRRQGTLLDPATRRPVRTTGLLGAALAAVDEDAGAPLLDAEGRIVGLMVGRKAVVAPERGEEAAGMGLRLRPEPREVVAVPASVVALVWPLLEQHRRVPRAALGVATLEMDDALRSQLDLDCGGHVVRDVTPGSPAAAAGLELHDVIVAVGGRPIAPGSSLHDVLLPYRPGSSVRLGIFRAGDRVEADLVVVERR